MFETKVGMLRIPSSEEYRELRRKDNKTLREKAVLRVCSLYRKFSESRLSGRLKLDGTLNVKDRLDWQVLYESVIDMGESYGYIDGNGDVRPYDYEEEAEKEAQRRFGRK